MSMPADKRRAMLMVLLAVGFASSQDAIVKAMSGGYPTWETVCFRGLFATPVFIVWLVWAKVPLWPLPKAWRLVLLRSLILFSAYMSFALSIATLPMANAVAIYFTMPFFVGGLSGWFLGEKVPGFRWAAILMGFMGILVSVRPGSETFQPASFLALYSALGYALGQMLGRKVSQEVDPLVIANMQSMFYLFGAGLLGFVVTGFHLDASGHATLAAMTRAWANPGAADIALMTLMGLFSAISSVFFVKAYQAAPANFVAPFEYSAMIWALLYGLTVFHDIPDNWTLAGAAIVVTAGLAMLWRDAHLQKRG
jgi:drug/metabolite transporter (DMT)-like permease